MTRPKKLNKRQRALTEEYYSLVPLLGGYFLQHRPPWQRASLRPDLEGEGFLALTKAARTYDPKRLPYPRAYFARAILNGMLKWIKRATRTPRENRMPLSFADDHVSYEDQIDHLRLAIEALPAEDWEFAVARFQEGATLRALSAEHQLGIKQTSARAHGLAAELAAALGIHLPPPKLENERPKGSR